MSEIERYRETLRNDRDSKLAHIRKARGRRLKRVVMYAPLSKRGDELIKGKKKKKKGD
jgi:hypothetical protein